MGCDSQFDALYERKDNIQQGLKQMVIPGMEYTREDYLHDFEDECKKELELTRKKNNDYGGPVDPWKNFREFGELGILVRMSDKFARLKTALVEKRGLEVNDESVEDTIRDLAIYSKILLLYRRAHRG